MPNCQVEAAIWSRTQFHSRMPGEVYPLSVAWVVPRDYVSLVSTVPICVWTQLRYLAQGSAYQLHSLAIVSIPHPIPGSAMFADLCHPSIAIDRDQSLHLQLFQSGEWCHWLP